MVAISSYTSVSRIIRSEPVLTYLSTSSHSPQLSEVSVSILTSGSVVSSLTCTHTHADLFYEHSGNGISVADPGGVRGVQMHPPFEGLPSRVLSKCAQT